MTRRLVAAVALLGLTVSGPALAQAPDPVHKADALFNAGRALLDAGEYADACPKFAEANALAPGLGVTLYLADCYERLGKTASSLVWFRRAVELAKAKNDKRGPVAGARADALVARVPTLVVKVSPEAQAQHVEITQDGARLPPSAWGVGGPIDPGDHVLDVRAEGKAPRHLVVRLAASAETRTETVGPLDAPTVEVAPPAPLVAASLAPPPQSPPSVQPASRPERAFLTAGLITAGVGVVGLGVGAALGLMAKSKLSDSNNGPCDATNHCTGAGLSLRSDAEHAGNEATIAFAVGGAAVAAGAIILIVRPKSGSAAASLGLSPAIARSGAGLNLGGEF